MMCSTVCGVVRSWNPADDPDKKHVEVENVIPIAGGFESSTGARLDPKVSRLKAQDSKADGLQIELNGGTYNKMKQKAVIQLQCDKERTGLEQKRLRRRDEKDDKKDKDDEKDDDDDEEEEPRTSSLEFVSYGQVEGKEKSEVLRLNWRTKFACEDYADSDEAIRKSGWGFFTWFILMYAGPPLRTQLTLTDTDYSQCLPGYRCLPHLRLVAELQSLRRTWLGPPATWRHDSRYPVLSQGLVS